MTGNSSAFNAALASAKTAAAQSGDTAAAQSANLTSSNLLRAVSADSSTVAALKKVGFSLNAGGSLVLDTKQLDAAQKADPAAVRATLNTLGQQVFNAATQELASNGNVGLSLSTLNQRSGILRSQQAALSALGQGANPTQSNTGFGSWTKWGFSAYQQNS